MTPGEHKPKEPPAARSAAAGPDKGTFDERFTKIENMVANFITDRVNETAPKAAAGKAVNTNPKLTKAQQQEVVMRVADKIEELDSDEEFIDSDIELVPPEK